MAHTTLVSAPSDATLGVQVATMATAIASAEGFRDKGEDALVILDDFSAIFKFWDTTSLGMLDLFGNERVDIGGDSEQRGFYSSFLQRSGQLSKPFGGGSLTMLVPVDESDDVTEIEKNSEETYGLDDFSDEAVYGGKTIVRIEALLAKGITINDQVCEKLGITPPGANGRSKMLVGRHIDQIISLADGHAVLSKKMRAQGMQPPLDPAQSLTRVGIGTKGSSKRASGASHAPALRKVTARLRLDLAYLQDLRFSSETESAIDVQAVRALAFKAAVSQDPGSPRSLGDQVLLLLAAEKGFLDHIFKPLGGERVATSQDMVAQASAACEGLIRHARDQAPHLLDDITATRNMKSADALELEGTIADFFTLRSSLK